MAVHLLYMLTTAGVAVLLMNMIVNSRAKNKVLWMIVTFFAVALGSGFLAAYLDIPQPIYQSY